MNVDKLERLYELKEKGAITAEEFEREKAKLLNEPALAGVDLQDVKQYAMLMHFAQFLGFIIPVLGWLAPLVMWLSRSENDYIDQNGRVIFNWIISALIYACIFTTLILIAIGIPLLVALFICSVIFTILGALRAKDGEIKNYPLTIKFLAVRESN
ncbi:DUF4870 domain-containing protein [Idiomarina xiamenensis]|uniref:SHOCT domain-containing protein n=1 Tax=Idiomarina xiamenensis 10-D-4 TaxID=740709 RepID=K2KA69_9GAMM|nr:DUF4870 domain-containing protein [Idiomarina xiamenensis]EKE83442.1 hypothetical protein A10D4_08472 [Idiomarina xiamenensis 10-D-4]